MHGDETRKQFLDFIFQGEARPKRGDLAQHIAECGVQLSDDTPPEARARMHEFHGVSASDVGVRPRYARRFRTGGGEPDWALVSDAPHPDQRVDGWAVVGTVQFDDGTCEENCEIAVFRSRSHADALAKQAG